MLETVYAAAVAVGIDERTDWIDPDKPSAWRYRVLHDAYPPHMWGNLKTICGVDRVFADSLRLVMNRVRAASIEWAVAMLDSQELIVGNLALVADQERQRLHDAALRARGRAADLLVSQPLTAEERREVLGPSRKKRDGALLDRLRRVAYMRAVRQAGDRYLLKLMAHPKGVQIVDAFAHSADGGFEFTKDLIDECVKAIHGVRGDLIEDEQKVWRFPPAVSAGVAALGRRRPAALTGLSLLWARVEGRRIDNALDIAGNAIFALQLVGGPIGAVLGDVLDFVLSLIRASVAFVRAVEQQQAGTASAFAAEPDKLSEGASAMEVALVGAAAISVAIALPGAVSQVTRRTGSRAKKLVIAAEHVPSPPNVPDPRMLERRAIGREARVDATRRMTDVARGTVRATTGEVAAIERRAVSAGATAEKKIGEPSRTPGTTQDATVANKATTAEGKGTRGRSVGASPPPPPPKRGAVRNVRTNHPGTDTRTASGGIATVDQYVNPYNRTVVQIEGRIDPVSLGETPKSIFRREWPKRSTLSPELATYERCHLFPLQWGDEAAAGFMYADKTSFNTSVHKRLENAVADLRRRMPPNAELRVKVTAISFERHVGESKWGNVLQELSYQFEIAGTGYRARIDFNVGPPPKGQISIAAPFATP